MARQVKSVDELFKIYKKQYKLSAKEMAKHGNQPALKQQTKRQFRESLKSEINTIKDAGKKLDSAQLAKQMARDDVYEASIKLAKAISRAAEKAGLKGYSAKAIRLGIVDYTEFDKAIEAIYKELKAQGKSSYEAKEIISSQYYGSP